MIIRTSELNGSKGKSQGRISLEVAMNYNYFRSLRLKIWYFVNEKWSVKLSINFIQSCEEKDPFFSPRREE